MAISFPATETTEDQRSERATARTKPNSLLVKAYCGLRRCYALTCSTIFYADGDCMRL